MSTIAFLTDFGATDPCVGICEGVMRAVAPGAAVVHLNHNVTPHDVHEAAFNLSISVPYFPDATVFCCVVDPGVGSERRAVAVRFLLADGRAVDVVAPDNGLATPLLEVADVEAAVVLDRPDYLLPNPSNTFHGRDVFAPASAHLAAGVPIEVLGSPVDPATLQRFPRREPVVRDGGWEAEILHVDRFGNVVTNLAGDTLGDDPSHWSVQVGGVTIPAVGRTFAEVAVGRPVAYVGSSGYVELAVRNGNAASTWGVGRGARVLVRPR